MPLGHNQLLKILVDERGPMLGFMFTVCRSRQAAEAMLHDLVVATSELHLAMDNRAEFLSWARKIARQVLSVAVRDNSMASMLGNTALALLEDEWETHREKHGQSLADRLWKPMLRREQLRSRRICNTPFVELMNRFFDGSIGPAELSTLELRLETESSARRNFVLVACIDALLNELSQLNKHAQLCESGFLNRSAPSDVDASSIGMTTLRFVMPEE